MEVSELERPQKEVVSEDEESETESEEDFIPSPPQPSTQAAGLDNIEHRIQQLHVNRAKLSDDELYSSGGEESGEEESDEEKSPVLMEPVINTAYPVLDLLESDSDRDFMEQRHVETLNTEDSSLSVENTGLLDEDSQESGGEQVVEDMGLFIGTQDYEEASDDEGPLAATGTMIVARKVEPEETPVNEEEEEDSVATELVSQSEEEKAVSFVKELKEDEVEEEDVAPVPERIRKKTPKTQTLRQSSTRVFAALADSLAVFLVENGSPADSKPADPLSVFLDPSSSMASAEGSESQKYDSLTRGESKLRLFLPEPGVDIAEESDQEEVVEPEVREVAPVIAKSLTSGDLVDEIRKEARQEPQEMAKSVYPVLDATMTAHSTDTGLFDFLTMKQGQEKSPEVVPMMGDTAHRSHMMTLARAVTCEPIALEASLEDDLTKEIVGERERPAQAMHDEFRRLILQFRDVSDVLIAGVQKSQEKSAVVNKIFEDVWVVEATELRFQAKCKDGKVVVLDVADEVCQFRKERLHDLSEALKAVRDVEVKELANCKFDYEFQKLYIDLYISNFFRDSRVFRGINDESPVVAYPFGYWAEATHQADDIKRLGAMIDVLFEFIRPPPPPNIHMDEGGVLAQRARDREIGDIKSLKKKSMMKKQMTKKFSMLLETNNHNFHETAMSKKVQTFCHVCADKIKQSKMYMCAQCGMVSHKKCLIDISTQCQMKGIGDGTISGAYAYQESQVADNVTQFVRDLCVWSRQLGSFLLRVASFHEHAFLLGELVSCRGVHQWGPELFQFPSRWEDAVVDHFIAMLGFFEAPLVYANDGRMIQHIQSSDGSAQKALDPFRVVLLEADFIALLEAFPFNQLMRYICEDSMQLRDVGNLKKVFALSSYLVQQLLRMMETFSFYPRLLDTLTNTIGFILKQVAAFAEKMDTAAMVEERDGWLIGVVMSLADHARYGSRLYPLCAALPLNVLSSEASWRLFRLIVGGFGDPSFSLQGVSNRETWDHFLGAEADGKDFILNFSNSLVRSKDFSAVLQILGRLAHADNNELAGIICEVVVDIAYIHQEGHHGLREACFAEVTEIGRCNPELILDILSVLDLPKHKTVSAADRESYIARLPLNLWKPEEDGLEFLLNWLLQTKTQPQAIQVFGALSWGMNSALARRNRQDSDVEGEKEKKEVKEKKEGKKASKRSGSSTQALFSAVSGSVAPMGAAARLAASSSEVVPSGTPEEVGDAGNDEGEDEKANGEDGVPRILYGDLQEELGESVIHPPRTPGTGRGSVAPDGSEDQDELMIEEDEFWNDEELAGLNVEDGDTFAADGTVRDLFLGAEFHFLVAKRFCELFPRFKKSDSLHDWMMRRVIALRLHQSRGGPTAVPITDPSLIFLHRVLGEPLGAYLAFQLSTLGTDANEWQKNRQSFGLLKTLFKSRYTTFVLRVVHDSFPTLILSEDTLEADLTDDEVPDPHSALLAPIVDALFKKDQKKTKLKRKRNMRVGQYSKALGALVISQCIHPPAHVIDSVDKLPRFQALILHGWMAELRRLPDWAHSPCELYVLSALIRAAVVGELRNHMHVALKAHLSTAVFVAGGGKGHANYPPPPHFGTFWDVPHHVTWITFETLLVETQMETPIRQDLAERLKAVSSHHDVKKAMKKMGCKKPLADMTIYRWYRFVMDLKDKHPLLSYCTQVFFSLYFESCDDGELHLHKMMKRDKIEALAKVLEDRALVYSKGSDVNPKAASVARLYQACSAWLKADASSVHVHVNRLPESGRLRQVLEDDVVNHPERFWYDLTDAREILAASLRKEVITFQRRYLGMHDSRKPSPSNKFVSYCDLLSKIEPAASLQPAPCVLRASATEHVSLEEMVHGRPLVSAVPILVDAARRFAQCGHEWAALDRTYVRSLGGLFSSETVKQVVNKRCKEEGCSGPARLVVQYNQKVEVKAVADDLSANRAGVVTLRTESDFGPLTMRALVQLKFALDHLMEANRRRGNRPDFMLEQLGPSVFVHMLPLLDSSVLAIQPLGEFVRESIAMVATSFVKGSVAQTPALLQVLLDYADRVDILLGYFDPASCPDQMLGMYNTLLDHVKKVAAAGSLHQEEVVKVFQAMRIDDWLDGSNAPILDERRRLIRGVLEALAAIGKKVEVSPVAPVASGGLTNGLEGTPVWNELLSILEAVLGVDFDMGFPDFLSLLLSLCDSYAVTPQVWLDLRKFRCLKNSPSNAEGFTEGLHVLQKYFGGKRKEFGARTDMSLYGAWVPYLEAFFAFLSHLCGVLLSDTATLPHPAGLDTQGRTDSMMEDGAGLYPEQVWRELMALLMHFVVTVRVNDLVRNAGAPPNAVSPPWLPRDRAWATSVLEWCVAFFKTMWRKDRMYTTEVFRFYVSFASISPPHVHNPIVSKLGSLSWSEMDWTEDVLVSFLTAMQNAVSVESLTFLVDILVQQTAKSWRRIPRESHTPRLFDSVVRALIIAIDTHSNLEAVDAVVKSTSVLQWHRFPDAEYVAVLQDTVSASFSREKLEVFSVLMSQGTGVKGLVTEHTERPNETLNASALVTSLSKLRFFFMRLLPFQLANQMHDEFVKMQAKHTTLSRNFPALSPPLPPHSATATRDASVSKQIYVHLEETCRLLTELGRLCIPQNRYLFRPNIEDLFTCYCNCRSSLAHAAEKSMMRFAESSVELGLPLAAAACRRPGVVEKPFVPRLCEQVLTLALPYDGDDQGDMGDMGTWETISAQLEMPTLQSVGGDEAAVIALESTFIENCVKSGSFLTLCALSYGLAARNPTLTRDAMIEWRKNIDVPAGKEDLFLLLITREVEVLSLVPGAATSEELGEIMAFANALDSGKSKVGSKMMKQKSFVTSVEFKIGFRLLATFCSAHGANLQQKGNADISKKSGAKEMISQLQKLKKTKKQYGEVIDSSIEYISRPHALNEVRELVYAFLPVCFPTELIVRACRK